MKKFLHARAFLFDFDGTLVDTMSGYADVAAEIISGHRNDISFQRARSLYLETSGIPFFQQLEIILPDDRESGSLAARFEEEKQAGLFASSFSDDARYTVETLRRKGYLVGISSNNQQELVDRFVAEKDLEFDVVMGYSPGFEKGKPHFNKFLETFHLAPGQLVFVGDSLKDEEKAAAAGIDFVALTGTFSSDVFTAKNPGISVIESLRELTV